MKPEDVPSELIEAAYQAYLRAPKVSINDVSIWGYALAAVWPEIERQVREQIAMAIDELIERGYPQPVTAGLQAARDVVRGEVR